MNADTLVSGGSRATPSRRRRRWIAAEIDRLDPFADSDRIVLLSARLLPDRRRLLDPAALLEPPPARS